MTVQGSKAYNPGWHLAHDLVNMIDVSLVVARCALQREESRGGHTRIDFDFSDNKVWRFRNSVASYSAEGELSVSYYEKYQMPENLKTLFEKPEEVAVVSESGGNI